MGYTTNFYGSFTFSRNLTDEEVAFINAFASRRHMRRDVEKLQAEYGNQYGNPFTPEDPLGPEGAYFVGGDHNDEYNHPSILDYNEPPRGQPGLWCQWVVQNMQLCWDGGEKFYNYVEWLQYLIEHFFAPWGVMLNGAIQWNGENQADIGVISVRNNNVILHYEEVSDDEDSESGENSVGSS